MHEPVQLPLLIEKPYPKQVREVEYVPPTLEQIDQFAHKVCYQLGKCDGATGRDTETVRGFAGFIQAIVQIKTNQLNRKGRYASQEI